ncbi:MAG: hypothetical protein ACOY94_21160 [Bacillota bacterium]
MDRLNELKGLYASALQLGEELLKALRAVVTDEGLERVEQLLSEREAVVQRTTALFEPSLQPHLEAELKALLEQQRALEGQMTNVQAHLMAQLKRAGETRDVMAGVRRALKTEARSRWVNERV